MTDPLRSEGPSTRSAQQRQWSIRRSAIGLLACWATIATVGVFALILQEGTNTAALDRSTRALDSSTQALHAIQQAQRIQNREILDGCIRFNVVRAEDNASHYADYVLEEQQIHFQSATLHANFAALSHIGLPKKVLRVALHQALASLATERAQARTKEWVPLTSCTAAVQAAGAAYRPPTPIPFIKGKPPQSALSQKNARLTDPVGSVP